MRSADYFRNEPVPTLSRSPAMERTTGRSRGSTSMSASNRMSAVWPRPCAMISATSRSASIRFSRRLHRIQIENRRVTRVTRIGANPAHPGNVSSVQQIPGHGWMRAIRAVFVFKQLPFAAFARRKSHQVSSERTFPPSDSHSPAWRYDACLTSQTAPHRMNA